MNHWELLDVVELLNRREEATTTANVGAFEVPLGQTPMRPAMTHQLDAGTLKRLEVGGGGVSDGWQSVDEYWASKKR